MSGEAATGMIMATVVPLMRTKTLRTKPSARRRLLTAGVEDSLISSDPSNGLQRPSLSTHPAIAPGEAARAGQGSVAPALALPSFPSLFGRNGIHQSPYILTKDLFSCLESQLSAPYSGQIEPSGRAAPSSVSSSTMRYLDAPLSP